MTLLRPEEQIDRLGTVGPRVGRLRARSRSSTRTATRCADGEVGELFSRTAYVFDGYWKNPEKTAEAFRGEWCSVGDMARRDADGYIQLVDRKSNMIISGGENIYPSEVEGVLGAHPKVKDVAVIGVPHEKWGEAVQAVVVLHDGPAGDGGRAPRLVPRAHGRLQAAALDRLHRRRRHAAHRHRQDPAPPAARLLRLRRNLAAGREESR